MSDNARTLTYFADSWREFIGSESEEREYLFNAARRWAAWIIAGEA